MDVISDTQSTLNTLKRQYFQLVEPSDFRWPDIQVLKSPSVQQWIFNNFFNQDTISSLPPSRYQLRVLKLLVSKLEKSIDDPQEDVRFLLFSLSKHVQQPAKLVFLTRFSSSTMFMHSTPLNDCQPSHSVLMSIYYTDYLLFYLPIGNIR